MSSYDQYPLTPLGNLMEFQNIAENILEEQITEQYENLTNLGVDFIRDQFVSNIIYEELILYVNQNYLPINHIDTIFENNKQTQIIGKFIYEFLCVDIINIILPQLIKTNEFKDPISLYSMNTETFKSFVSKYIESYCDNLKMIIEINYNTSIHKQLIKWLFYLDLIDNNLDSFIINFLHPVIDIYDVELYSRA